MENDMLSSLLSDPESLQNAMKTVSDLLGETPGALPAVPEGPTAQFLKLFLSLDDKAQNEIVAEMLKRKK